MDSSFCLNLDKRTGSNSLFFHKIEDIEHINYQLLLSFQRISHLSYKV
jgi:hypothetical protein